MHCDKAKTEQISNADIALSHLEMAFGCLLCASNYIARGAALTDAHRHMVKRAWEVATTLKYIADERPGDGETFYLSNDAATGATEEAL